MIENYGSAKKHRKKFTFVGQGEGRGVGWKVDKSWGINEYKYKNTSNFAKIHSDVWNDLFEQ